MTQVAEAFVGSCQRNQSHACRPLDVSWLYTRVQSPVSNRAGRSPKPDPCECVQPSLACLSRMTFTVPTACGQGRPVHRAANDGVGLLEIGLPDTSFDDASLCLARPILDPVNAHPKSVKGAQRLVGMPLHHPRESRARPPTAHCSTHKTASATHLARRLVETAPWP